MYLVGPVADFLTLFQLLNDVRVAGCGQESREPIQPGDNAVLDLASRHLTRPADHRRRAEAALHNRALALRERRLSAVRPRKDFGTIVGGEDDDGVVVDTHVL